MCQARESNVLVSLYRYNPEVDDKPRMQDYEIELPGGKDLMVLDVLELLKRQDPSIAYRRSCREGVNCMRKVSHSLRL